MPFILASSPKKTSLPAPHIAWRVLRLGLVALALCVLISETLSRAQGLATSSTPALALDSGYRQMYNLRFADAHKSFAAFERSNPGDPLGPASDAAAYLFSEFDRLGVLQTELFVDDEMFNSRQKLAPDAATRRSFDADISKSEQLADMVLMKSTMESSARAALPATSSPAEINALFAKVLNRGLRADYLAMIEKRNLAALSSIKSARVLAEKLLSADPSCYDAYLAVGIENYMLGLNPAPVRWAMRTFGAQTDKEQGIEKLRLTAEKGHYLLPYARLMLAVAALRDKDTARARQLLEGLAKDYPENSLYSRELSRIH